MYYPEYRGSTPISAERLINNTENRYRRIKTASYIRECSLPKLENKVLMLIKLTLRRINPSIVRKHKLGLGLGKGFNNIQ